VSELDWSEQEQVIARIAFDTAYKREISALIQEINEQASTISDIEQIWGLHDYLSAKRHDIDGKYDYHYSVLIFVFARLVKEGWLELSELADINPDKLAKVAALSRM
jgi:hypothetical protein